MKINQIPIPVAYSTDFEGEHLREKQLYVELGNKASPAIELLISKNLNEIEDGLIELIGKDIHSLCPGEKALPFAVIIETAGRKMQKDFEPILERQIHRFINYASGIAHIGQRDTARVRISQDSFNKGLRLKHLGVMLYEMFHQQYSAIIDKIQIKLYTCQDDVDKLKSTAKRIFEQRDQRINGITDESVDTYYSCSICQSFAHNHVCIITPERSGLCGAYSWLDAKASYENIPSGPNLPIEKGQVLDERFGQWKNVNEFIYDKSNKTIDRVNMYSLIDSPQPSCGTPECIAAIIPEVNGIMVVHRNYPGMTPVGMTFNTLASVTGQGRQTPGFLGIALQYITSKKFILAEGGLKRLVWMPKELKELLKNKLEKRAQDIDAAGIIDKIADEIITVDLEQLQEFLQKTRHPALEMGRLV
ncbi:MAG: CO dehydrogenase/CO-methylating acetyl-CoA synthase complex subunit beta [Candidatus Omnitrophota bacterium]